MLVSSRMDSMTSHMYLLRWTGYRIYCVKLEYLSHRLDSYLVNLFLMSLSILIKFCFRLLLMIISGIRMVLFSPLPSSPSLRSELYFPSVEFCREATTPNKSVSRIT